MNGKGMSQKGGGRKGGGSEKDNLNRIEEDEYDLSIRDENEEEEDQTGGESSSSNASLEAEKMPKKSSTVSPTFFIDFKEGFIPDCVEFVSPLIMENDGVMVESPATTEFVPQKDGSMVILVYLIPRSTHIVTFHFLSISGISKKLLVFIFI